MSIKEFTKAAGRYESSHAGIYEMCKKDYPDPQAFFDSVKRCLRPNGRLVLRDVTSDNKVLVWLMNTLEMPLANICGHGDVQVPTRDVVIKCCKKAGLKVEKFEIRKGMRMHCVVKVLQRRPAMKFYESGDNRKPVIFISGYLLPV